MQPATAFVQCVDAPQQYLVLRAPAANPTALPSRARLQPRPSRKAVQLGRAPLATPLAITIVRPPSALSALYNLVSSLSSKMSSVVAR